MLEEKGEKKYICIGDYTSCHFQGTQNGQCKRQILLAEVKLRPKFYLIRGFHIIKHSNQTTTALTSNYLISAAVQGCNYCTLSSSLAAVKLCFFMVCLYNTEKQHETSCYSDLTRITFQSNTSKNNYRIKPDLFSFFLIENTSLFNKIKVCHGGTEPAASPGRSCKAPIAF